jgi:hypothetical protein
MNMGYCRFQNTLVDLKDCINHMDDMLSPKEEKAKNKLINECILIANEYDEDESK